MKQGCLNTHDSTVIGSLTVVHRRRTTISLQRKYYNVSMHSLQVYVNRILLLQRSFLWFGLKAKAISSWNVAGA